MKVLVDIPDNKADFGLEGIAQPCVCEKSQSYFWRKISINRRNKRSRSRIKFD